MEGRQGCHEYKTTYIRWGLVHYQSEVFYAKRESDESNSAPLEVIAIEVGNKNILGYLFIDQEVENPLEDEDKPRKEEDNPSKDVDETF